MFNTGKIKKLEQENEDLRRTIDQLRAINDAHKFSIENTYDTVIYWMSFPEPPKIEKK